MQPFRYERARDVAAATAAVARDPGASFLAGGTEMLNWLKEGIAGPERLVDINRLTGLAGIEFSDDSLRIGSLARMSDVAAHPLVRARFPAISEALLNSASQQLRNMASMGGNLLQKTRCPYFRADATLPCNKRMPGSGCSTAEGNDRHAALFGGSETCLAVHASDVAVALAAFDAVVHVRGEGAARAIGVEDFFRVPGDDATRETTLEHGELIVSIEVPAGEAARRSHYLKVRERASYEFALVSVAMGVELEGMTIRDVRIALGGVAPKPWRLRDAETILQGGPFAQGAVRRALEAPFSSAEARRDNAFKIELAKRAVVRAAQTLGAA